MPPGLKTKAESWDGLLRKWADVPGGTLAVPSTYSISERSHEPQLKEGDTLQPPVLPDPAAFDQWFRMFARAA